MNINHALAVRSDFSIGESTLQIKKAVELAKEMGYESLAVVDNMSLSGMVDLSSRCKEAGIKPVYGCTVRVYDDPTLRGKEEHKANRFYWLKVYAKSERGIQSLLKTLSIGFSEAHFYYNARVGLQEILNLEDCIVTTGDFFPVWHHPDHMNIVAQIAARMPVYADLVPIATPLYDTLNRNAIHAISTLGIEPLVCWPMLYQEGRADSLDVLRAISKNMQIDSMWLERPYVRDFAMLPPATLVQRIKASIETLRLDGVNPQAYLRGLDNMGAIAEQCSFEFKKLEPSLPKMADDEFGELVRLCKEGWANRFGRKVLGHQPTPSDMPEYQRRLAYELGVLRDMGFSGYFLLVREIVAWSKSQGIKVGPGRGSVGGSLVAYLLEITDVDPIRFGLFFERFINPSRLDLPDADLDFQSARRAEVIDYIVNRFGRDRVAGISNYNTLGPALALRDVARLSGLDPIQYNCSKQMEKEHGVAVSLTESRESVPDIDKFANAFPKVWEHAVALEGCVRSTGQHAAGVVVAGEPITNRAVVETRSGGPVTSWDKRVVEDWGLIKMDILGLTTLDVIEKALQFIYERHGKRVDMLGLPLDDARVMKAFGEGKTVGVFQFESGGMRGLLKNLAKVAPLTFEDITATTALFRPGPLDAGLTDDYVAIKQGARAPSYEHPAMEAALRETYSVMVYQEQVMQICRDLAGFTMAEADNVRKAIGKKDKEKMAKQGDQFVAGAIAAGMAEYTARELWAKIELFGGYAFNKSHSVEYTVISYWLMWLKVYYGAEFYAASLTIVDKVEKIEPLIADAAAQGITVLPPDINRSTNRIEILSDTELLAPFNAVKGLSETAAGDIVALRAALGGVFASVDDFKRQKELLGKPRVTINSGHLDKLDKVGAFASIVPGSQPATHPDRLKDRLQLTAGWVVETVKADRSLDLSPYTRTMLIHLQEEVKRCDKCSLKGGVHPATVFGKSPKVMVVFDAPTFSEDRAGKLMEGETAKILRQIMHEAGFSPNDAYYTALVRSAKPKGQSALTNEQINGCVDWLKHEIELLKPAIIVPMGSNSIRHFLPGLKGNTLEMAGKAVFDATLDANIVIGASPGRMFKDMSVAKHLVNTFSKVAELL